MGTLEKEATELRWVDWEGFMGRFGMGFYLLAVILKLYFIMQKMQELNVVERVKAPTPKFFKRIRSIGLVLGAVGTTILTAGTALPAVAVTVAGYMVTVGAVAAAVSQTTVDWRELEQRQRSFGI